MKNKKLFLALMGVASFAAGVRRERQNGQQEESFLKKQ
jgi:hypothetical protein